MNIKTLLNQGATRCASVSDSAQLDAELLLSFALKKSRSFLRTWPEFIPTQVEIDLYWQSIEKRCLPTPVAYLIGYKEFWSRDFLVNHSTLIPRPETELLIEQSIQLLSDAYAEKNVLDLGTGSGCIAITLKKELSQSNVVAVDISKDALAVAKQNATIHEADIHWIHSSWFTNVPKLTFDLIVSNPPYIACNDRHLTQGDVQAEPITALASGEMGLDDIQKIANQCKPFLKPSGYLLFEHGYNQADSIKLLLTKLQFTNITHHKDLQGINRVTSCQLDL